MNIRVGDALLQVFNVEHGACALLTCRAGNGYQRLMVDCGHNSSARWYPGWHLRRLGISQLEQLVVTNYDEDHVSGFPSLVENGIRVMWLARNTSVSPPAIHSLKSESGIGRGMSLLVGSLSQYVSPQAGVLGPSFPGVTYEFFSNPYPYFEDENNLSLAAFVSVHGINFFFPGDLESAGLLTLLWNNPRLQALAKTVHVLMAPHHGRENGICRELFDVFGCAPRLVVISDSYLQYGSQETIDFYSGKCIGIEGFRVPGVRKVLTTRCDGEICFGFEAGRCVVH